MTTIGDILTEKKQLLGPESEPEILTLTEGNGFVPQSSRFGKRLATEDTSKYKLIRRHDFAFNPYLLWAGAIARNEIYESAIISPLYPTFSVESGVDPGYAEILLTSKPVRKLFDQISFGSIPRRRRASVQDFLSIPLPPLPSILEQRRISQALSHAARVECTSEVQGRLLRSLVNAAVARLPAHSIEMRPLPELLLRPLRNGISPSSKGKYPGSVLTLASITGTTFKESAHKTGLFDSPPLSKAAVEDGALLICRGSGSRDLVGVGAVVTLTRPDLSFPDTMIEARFDTDRLRAGLVQHLWNSDLFQERIKSRAKTTNGTYKISQADLHGLEFPVPSQVAQEDLGALIKAVSRVQQQVLARQELSEELHASLQYRAFRGEL